MTTFSVSPPLSGFRQRDQSMGPSNTTMVPAKALMRALTFQKAMRPSDRATMRPKRARLEAHTHREPPRVPSTEYH